MEEIWKPTGYPYYDVSNCGRVRRLDSIVRSHRGTFRKQNGRILKASLMTIGYVAISMWVDGKEIKKSLHVLLATAFIPNPENKKYINHKNGIRNDNRLENIEWCTQSENIRHCIDVLGKTLISNGIKIFCIDNGKTYETKAMAARDLKICETSVTRYLKKEVKIPKYNFIVV